MEREKDPIKDIKKKCLEKIHQQRHQQSQKKVVSRRKTSSL
jgi:hypothetical protein